MSSPAWTVNASTLSSVVIRLQTAGIRFIQKSESEKLTLRDESDEDDCKTIVMKENYSKTIAPFFYDTEKNENLPARVNVSMSVMDVLNIKEVDHTYNLKFKLRLQWFDYRWELKSAMTTHKAPQGEIPQPEAGEIFERALTGRTFLTLGSAAGL